MKISRNSVIYTRNGQNKPFYYLDQRLYLNLTVLTISKGFIDRSPDSEKRGPINFVEQQDNTWTCEIGILPKHQPDAITKMRGYYRPFAEGDFSKLLTYMLPHDDKPEPEEL